jgi:hypothetical protein
MTGARFATSCPTSAASILDFFISSLPFEPRMEGTLTCCFLTISLFQTTWATWSASETLYNGENEIFTWETYVRIHMEQNYVLNGLKDYVYAGIYDSFKVRHLLKGTKTTELDVYKTQIMVSPTLPDDFTATVEL